jgi:hypothetical protein
MFTQTWKKYLPVIHILLKRSVNGPQSLDMNRSDFERAAGGRKVKLNFSFTLTKGKPAINSAATPLVRDLVTLLAEDPATRALLQQQIIDFSMNSSCQLQITPVGIVASTETVDSDSADTGDAGDNSASN